jgi:hypothetical protein
MDRADADASHAARVLVVLLAHAWHTGWGIQKCTYDDNGMLIIMLITQTIMHTCDPSHD